MKFVSAQEKVMNSIIQFDLADLDGGHGPYRMYAREWTLKELKDITVKSQRLVSPDATVNGRGDGW